MSWFRIDDKSAFHRKVLKAGNEAWGAICRAGAVSAGEGTDGIVTVETMEAIAPMRVWDRAVKAGLVDKIDDSSYQLHDYLQWNESAAEVAAKSAARRAKSTGAANTRWGARGRTAHATSNAPSMLQASPKQRSEHAPGNAKPMPQAHTSSCPSPYRSRSRSDPEISPETGSLPPPSERARAPEAAAAAAPNPAVAQVLDALSREKPLRGVATTAFAQDLARFCNEHGFTGPRTLEATLTSIGEASAKVSQAENIGEPLGNRQIAALVHGCVRTGPRGSTGATAGRHRQPGLGHYEQTNAEDV